MPVGEVDMHDGIASVLVDIHLPGRIGIPYCHQLPCRDPIPPLIQGKGLLQLRKALVGFPAGDQGSCGLQRELGVAPAPGLGNAVFMAAVHVKLLDEPHFVQLPRRSSCGLCEGRLAIGAEVHHTVAAKVLHENEQIGGVALAAVFVQTVLEQETLLPQLSDGDGLLPVQLTLTDLIVQLAVGGGVADTVEGVSAVLLLGASAHDLGVDLKEQLQVLLQHVHVIDDGLAQAVHYLKILGIFRIVFLAQLQFLLPALLGEREAPPGSLKIVCILRPRGFIVPDQLIHRDLKEVCNSGQKGNVGVSVSALPLTHRLGGNLDGLRQLLLGQAPFQALPADAFCE